MERRVSNKDEEGASGQGRTETLAFEKGKKTPRPGKGKRILTRGKGRKTRKRREKQRR